ncbi:DUF3302 domain-containing protein [Lysobacter sp. TAF61]|uniref:DUF3302 domain-containing protein n=1 Tax=Lysobacter sp. TAF61 TaxID=3233072 RepID=UPI003F99AEF6
MATLVLHSGQAFASGGLEDAIADVMVWVVIVVTPVLALSVFWVVHVWPERVAEARNHPQKEAIQALCLLSLVFGGLLWPLAMLWAYMKPLRFRLEPSVENEHEGRSAAFDKPLPGKRAAIVPDPHFDDAADDDRIDEELVLLRQRVAVLQGRLDALTARNTSLHG